MIAKKMKTTAQHEDAENQRTVTWLQDTCPPVLTSIVLCYLEPACLVRRAYWDIPETKEPLVIIDDFVVQCAQDLTRWYTMDGIYVGPDTQEKMELILPRMCSPWKKGRWFHGPFAYNSIIRVSQPSDKVMLIFKNAKYETLKRIIIGDANNGCYRACDVKSACIYLIRNFIRNKAKTIVDVYFVSDSFEVTLTRTFTLETSLQDILDLAVLDRYFLVLQNNREIFLFSNEDGTFQTKWESEREIRYLVVNESTDTLLAQGNDCVSALKIK